MGRIIYIYIPYIMEKCLKPPTSIYPEDHETKWWFDHQFNGDWAIKHVDQNIKTWELNSWEWGDNEHTLW